MSDLNDKVLLWLDSDNDPFDPANQLQVEKLREIIDEIHLFSSPDACVDFLTDIEQQHAYLIISEALARSIIPPIHAVSCLQSVYITGYDSNQELQTWMQTWPKMKGIYSDIASIQDKLRLAMKQFDKDSTPMSFTPSLENILEDVGNINLDRLEPSFMYTQLFKEALLTMRFDESWQQDFIALCRNRLALCPSEEKVIDEFQRDYTPDRAIWWYTRECFTYRLLNQALRFLQADVILTMGFFLVDLHRQIEQLHRAQVHHYHGQPFTVYRGQRLSKTDFSRLEQTVGGLISFNSFLSTSRSDAVPSAYAESALSEIDVYGILFVITVDPTLDDVLFADITKFSYFSEEDEILFSMHSVFRIQSLASQHSSGRLFRVNLTLTEKNDKQLEILTETIREESNHRNPTNRLASLLVSTGQTEMISRLYQDLPRCTSDVSVVIVAEYYQACMELKRGEQREALLRLNELLYKAQASLPQYDHRIGSTYSLLGSAYFDQGNYSQALSNHDKALEIAKKSLPPYHPDLATSYGNIGLAYSKMGDYSQALSHYDKALQIRKKSLPPNHPDLAASYENIGLAYSKMGDYSQALSHYDKALEIAKKSLPPNHPDLATSYNNIGLAYSEMGEYSQALSHYDKALEIRKRSLPPYHPDLATSYHNIGFAYCKMGEYSQALSHYEKALEIQKKSLPPNHPDLATSYNNIGLAYSEMGDYSQALSHYDKSLEIAKKSLPPYHPDLATSYNNIGLAYSEMGEYSQALSHYDKSLEIAKKSLPPNHPHLATSYGNIGLAYWEMGDYSQALSHYDKSLEIAKKSLPPYHPYLATAYNNIGLAYSKMGDCSQALSHYDKALEIRKKSLPPDHPYLATAYNNIGLAYSKMGEYSQALSQFDKSLEIAKKSLPPNHPDLASSYQNIGFVKLKLGVPGEAVGFWRNALKILQGDWPADFSAIQTLASAIEIVQNEIR